MFVSYFLVRYLQISAYLQPRSSCLLDSVGKGGVLKVHDQSVMISAEQFEIYFTHCHESRDIY